MNNEKEIKDKLLKLFEEIDRQSDEQELYIKSCDKDYLLLKKVCYEANGYLKTKTIRLDLFRLAVQLRSGTVGKNKGAQYLVMEDWEQC